MYALVAEVCKKADAGSGIKNLIYNLEGGECKQIPSIRALVDTTLRNKVAIDELIGKTKLAQEINFLELWVTRVLVAELVFGRKSFPVTDDISRKVYGYKAQLREHSRDVKKIEREYIPRYCRINTLNCTISEFYSAMAKDKYIYVKYKTADEVDYEEFLDLVRGLKKREFLQDYHLPYLFVFHPKSNLTESHLYEECKIVLQDKASCLVAPLLAPTPGSIMVDMCAAPGLKTQHLSVVAGLSGMILAIDINTSRYKTLADTVSRYELSNVMPFNSDAIHLPEIATKCIEYILLDAPCSGSGVVSNFDYGTDDRSTAVRLKSLHNLQAFLLRTALTKYPSARRIVYSTCSLNAEENEAVVDEMLDIAKENQFELINLKNHYQDFSSGLDSFMCGSHVIRLGPEVSCTNGFFIALFDRLNPTNPVPRRDFYDNLSEIMNAINTNKKRKAEDDYENVEETVVEPPCGVGENCMSPVKPEEKKVKNERSSSDDSCSSTEEELNVTTKPSSSPLNNEKGLIRVVSSPLLKDPNLKTKTDTSEEESSSTESDSSEGIVKTNDEIMEHENDIPDTVENDEVQNNSNHSKTHWEPPVDGRSPESFYKWNKDKFYTNNFQRGAGEGWKARHRDNNYDGSTPRGRGNSNRSRADSKRSRADAKRSRADSNRSRADSNKYRGRGFHSRGRSLRRYYD